MKTIWKGSISFGLVSIRVNLYSAIQEHVIGFKLLHAKCHTPINYQRWCSKCKTEIPWADIVKGYKLPDDTYFILTKENLEKLKPEKTDVITITEFVKTEAIAPIYYDEHYYVLPSKETEKAYFLFIEALKDLNMVAVGQFVMREKEYAVTIAPYQKGLLLSTLNYAYEIRESKELEALKAPAHISKQELQLAEQLIKKLAKKTFDISRYKDTFVEKLKERIKRLTRGKPLPKTKKVGKIRELPSLIAALQASLKHKPTESRRAR